MTEQINYPVSFNIDYKTNYNRLTTFFRLIVAIPIVVLFSFLTCSTNFIIFPTMIMILFYKKYPKWWFDFNLALTQFSARIGCYIALLTDEYPSTDQEQRVHLSFKYPDAESELNRFLPLIKWLLAIPHYIVLFFLILAGIIFTVMAWFTIIFTGKYPKSIFDFQIGLIKWITQVQAYTLFLITDQYPPFSLK